MKKIIKRTVFLCLCIICFYNVAYADVFSQPASLGTIVQQIPKPQNIKCKFKQEKHLQNISKPIVSGGDFEFVENKGVYFHTRYPVQTEIDYTNKNYKQINDVITAISNKKYSRLEKEFNFFYSKDGLKWILGMKPKTKSAASGYISAITISGKDYITQISITQTNGNKTVIWFTK